MPQLDPFLRYKVWNINVQLRSLEVNSDGMSGLPIYDFLLLVNSKISSTSKPNLWDILETRVWLFLFVKIVTFALTLILETYWIQGFEIWMTLNLASQCHSSSSLMVWLDSPYITSNYCYSNLCPNSPPLWDISLQNLSDLEITEFFS